MSSASGAAEHAYRVVVLHASAAAHSCAVRYVAHVKCDVESRFALGHASGRPRALHSRVANPRMLVLLMFARIAGTTLAEQASGRMAGVDRPMAACQALQAYRTTPCATQCNTLSCRAGFALTSRLPELASGLRRHAVRDWAASSYSQRWT